ncbi:hypothetical protein [Pseudomonas gingeri]|uniref:hypothetical protein n=1 Tax=Pseudomonas gingeri TaxID=117681 RepID=UPI001C4C15E7|nr:hypothetical protein [Pseudomonas gingeri]
MSRVDCVLPTFNNFQQACADRYGLLMSNSGFLAPAFITFTGVDSDALIPGMRALSEQYPIEWGVLIDPARLDNRLFPDAETVDRIRCSGLRLSAHICGVPAGLIASGGEPDLNLDGFSRLQINHGFSGSNGQQIEHCMRFASRHGMRAALQCQAAFPEVSGVDWLYDVSFGTGMQPEQWIALKGDIPFCGYSGGLNPQNVRSVLQQLDLGCGSAYWIDMESGVRSHGRFDLAKCEDVCRAVYGPLAVELPKVAM